jgi:hypothetical protein
MTRRSEHRGSIERGIFYISNAFFDRVIDAERVSSPSLSTWIIDPA